MWDKHDVLATAERADLSEVYPGGHNQTEMPKRCWRT
jgi:hypothetical protein